MSSELFLEPIEREEHFAIQAVARGDADEYQQALCIAVIVKKLARTWHLQYIPESERGSSFLSGRSYVGRQLTLLINTKVRDSDEPPKIGGDDGN